MAHGVSEITDGSFEKEVLQSATPALVDFWAVWCGPCRAIAPVVEQLAGEYAGKVKFTKLNVDENPQVAQKFDIRSIPTLLIFKDGKVSGQIVGAVPKAKIEEMIKRAL